MVFRTLGDVDNALEAVDKSDAAQTLRTIENFAVECSINKVWSSETLAFVVDEALQIYGGYGYSKEYPAERAYRDARITRLYEGTNEINRLIIPTRLLKNQVTAHLFAGENAQNLLENNRTVSENRTFSAERDLLSRAKKLLVFLLNRAKSTYADKLSNEQEILGHIADMTIEIYAVESAVLRAEKLSNKNNEAKNAIAADMTRSYASDAADRIEHSAKQVAAALSESEDVFERVQKLTEFKTYNTVAARRRIADAVIEAGRYYF
jgi:butyryl-CoA dehydrogenase